ncbi:uncharacterized protein EV420DRAFT_1659747 [Desarmillaria tabescens]|uniref:Uncharacterized protein n=1 Tax=Armillaria tabescens TaxID=1929756 RepID=A0AA39TXQ7_ARMTA|nr:uncharacterized protein EV420DRAFT_1659747 [Desarmillaria tabescens]KAK0469423.1 hypothetical protein EV420DRAFT_1659747 [Desarmillaria tabescens]
MAPFQSATHQSDSPEAVAEASLIVVGEILPSRFWVDKVGGWKKEFGALRGAKFSLALGEPQDPAFATDWANAVGRLNSTISQLSGPGSKSENVRSCIQTENHSTQIRFSAPVFEPLEPGTTVLDSLIQRWSVDPEHQEALNALKTGFRVTPLRVFDIDDNPVRAENMVGLLKGALAEVHFSIRHWNIQRAGQVPQQSFSCTINQICVLKRAPPPPPSPYKGSSRPYRPVPIQPGPAPLLPAAELPVNAAASASVEVDPLSPIPNRCDNLSTEAEPRTPTPTSTSRRAMGFGTRLNFIQLPTPPTDTTPPGVGVSASHVLGNHNISPTRSQPQHTRPIPVDSPGQENIPIPMVTAPSTGTSDSAVFADPRRRAMTLEQIGARTGRGDLFTRDFDLSVPIRPQGVQLEEETSGAPNAIAGADGNDLPEVVLGGESATRTASTNTKVGVMDVLENTDEALATGSHPPSPEVPLQEATVPLHPVVALANATSEGGNGQNGLITIRLPAKKQPQGVTKEGGPRSAAKRKADSDADGWPVMRQRTAAT